MNNGEKKPLYMRILENQVLSRRTFYAVGGVADRLVEGDDIEKIAAEWARVHADNETYAVLGGGSNSVWSDAGLRGTVFCLKNNAIEWLADDTVRVGAGARWQRFVEETNRNEWADLCALSGIPGNIGGFIRGNAGAMGMETVDRLQEVGYADINGNIKVLSVDNYAPRYRGSVFKDTPEWLVLWAVFRLQEQGEAEESLQKTREMNTHRWVKYPSGRTVGSTFKNPEGDYAGRLLEASGAKGDRIGNMEITQEHANFIRNIKDGRQADFIALVQKWQQIVYKTNGIWLVPEVHIIDEFGTTIDLSRPSS